MIFLDTFEALGAGLQGAAQRHEREAWVRSLHLTDSPVLLVLAGRDRLVWEECDDEYREPTSLMEQHLVGGLSETDARTFLDKCEITDTPLQGAILRVSVDTESGTAGSERGYHPFSLGLCADAVLSARSAGREVDPATFDMRPGDIGTMALRFMKSIGNPAHEIWVRRLGLTPRFDEEAGRTAFAPNRDASQDAAWLALHNYSFVQNTDEPGWWTLHAKMRDALAGGPKNANNPHHVFWRDYWQDHSQSETDNAASLAWYHGWCLDAEKAWQNWRELARRLRQGARMAEHRSVLEWWRPTGLFRHTTTSLKEAEMFSTLGGEFFSASRGDRGENLRRAIECYEAALQVFTEDAFPYEWAKAHNDLATIYWNLPTGDRGENLRKAFASYEKALRVRTETSYPLQWARTQNNLGAAYWYVPDGDPADNLRKSAACYEAALRVATESAFPREWAMTQHNLGTTYRKLAEILQDGTYLRMAIACYEAALRVATESADPVEWANNQDYLGTAYRELPDGDRRENIRKAIRCYQAALHVRNEKNFPEQWGHTSFNLGLALDELSRETKDPSLLPAALTALADAERGYLAVGMAEVAEEVHAVAMQIRDKLSAR